MTKIPKNVAYLVRRGLAVFPTVAGRKAFIAGLKWSTEASKDPIKIEGWAKKYPNCNWGVACGPSGLFVLDVDGAEGENSLLLLDNLPDTFEVKTPHGRHLYYYGQGRSGVDIAPWDKSHLDSRSVGGMVFAPGSQTEDGEYKITQNRPIVDAPQWLIDLVGEANNYTPDQCVVAEDNPADIERARFYLADAEIAVEGAGGDAHTYQTACAVRDFGISESKCLELMAIWNERCEPPWDVGDLATKISNAYNYSRDSQGNQSVTAEFDSDIGEIEKIGDDPLDVINQEFCAVRDGPNFLIYRESRDPSSGETVWTALSKQTFTDMLTRNVEIDNKIAPLNKIWLCSRKRRTADWVIFDPALKPGFSKGKTYSKSYERYEGVLNLWSGWAIDPTPGDWSLIREDLIKNLICSGDDESYNYVLDWMARLVQYPQVPGEVALVLRGKKGVGKSTLGEFLHRICGKHSMIVNNSSGITGQFTGHLLNKIFLFADEAYWAGDKKGEGQFKNLITGSDIPIRAMHKDAELRRNRLHILMASNSAWVVPATDDERRFAVFDVAEHRRGDSQFWSTIYSCAAKGGLAAMLHDLLSRNITGFVPSEVPLTEALADQKIESFGVEGEWWEDILHEGKLPDYCMISGSWESENIAVNKDMLYDDYLRYANSRPRNRSTKNKSSLMRYFLARFEIKSHQNASGSRSWMIPDLSTCRAHWERLIGFKREW